MSDMNYSRPGKQIGQGMLIVCFLAAIGTLTFVFDDILGNQANPNQSPITSTNSDGSNTVELRQNRQGHYVANGFVNGIPVTFLLDTGATDVAVPRNVAAAAGLDEGYQGQASTANGVVTVYSTNIAELTLGNIQLANISASITPSMPDDIILLGMSALRQIEFSQRGTTLTLNQTSRN